MISKSFLLILQFKVCSSSDNMCGCLISIVEFRTEELMKKAVEKVNKHNFNGRPLKVKEVGHVEENYKAA